MENIYYLIRQTQKRLPPVEKYVPLSSLTTSSNTSKQQVTFGRGTVNDITLHTVCVSRTHARIEKNGTKIELIDLNSTFGTCIIKVKWHESSQTFQATSKTLVDHGASMAINSRDFIQFSHKSLEEHGFSFQFISFQDMNVKDQVVVREIYSQTKFPVQNIKLYAYNQTKQQSSSSSSQNPNQNHRRRLSTPK